jgi:TolA-binding protein
MKEKNRQKTKEEKIEYQVKLQEVARQIAAGEFNIKEYYGFTDEGLEAIYAIGYEMYQHKQYEKAKDIFVLLTMLDPSSVKYLSAAGSACFSLEDFQNAAVFFRFTLLGGEAFTPKNLMRLAECTLKLGNFEETKMHLQETVRLSQTDVFKDDKDSQMCSARAAMMLKFLDRKEQEDQQAADATSADAQEQQTQLTSKES